MKRTKLEHAYEVRGVSISIKVERRQVAKSGQACTKYGNYWVHETGELGAKVCAGTEHTE